MATVQWPSNEVSKSNRFAYLKGKPFILGADEEYLDGINAYIYERVRGSLPAKINGERRFRLKPLGRHARSKLAYNLCDAATWMESPAAHPILGPIDWRKIEPWHISELYMDAMLQGFWSENYWAKGVPAPLSPRTVKERVGEAIRCFSWTARNEYSGPFEYEPEIHVIQLAKDDALHAYRAGMRRITVESVPTRIRPVRKQPGDLPLPTLEHLHDYYAAFPKGPARLATLQIFETGMRLEEVIENTLIPGKLHQRDRSDRAFCIHPTWPEHPYLLEYNLKDDRMLGVIPTRELAWSPSTRSGYQCEYRIVGKGPKIRKVNIPPVFVQSLWAHIDGKRRSPSAHVYVNRDGNKLSSRQVWAASRAVNEKLAALIDITPHVLRHAYACYFLETAIIDQGQKQGYSVETIPDSFIKSFGETVLLTLKSQLGHSAFSTTRLYLQQLASGQLGLRYHRLWNAFLDEAHVE